MIRLKSLWWFVPDQCIYSLLLITCKSTTWHEQSNVEGDVSNPIDWMPLESDHYSLISSSLNYRTNIIDAHENEREREREREQTKALFQFFFFYGSSRNTLFSLSLSRCTSHNKEGYIANILRPFLLSSWESLVCVYTSFIIIMMMGRFWLTQSKSSQLCVHDKLPLVCFDEVGFFFLVDICAFFLSSTQCDARTYL